MVDIYINFTFTRNAQKRKIYFIVFKFSNGSSFFFFLHLSVALGESCQVSHKIVFFPQTDATAGITESRQTCPDILF